ncbi:MAG: SDR family oxidoreductase [Rhodobacteraceae bacterium]|nr:SDR family oxidoreductase [Paracoccaceae bacterium]
MTHRLLSIGHGYVAEALAGRLADEGWQVRAISRDPGRVARLEAAGREGRLWPGTQGQAAALLDGVSHVLSSVPPDRTGGGDPALAAFGPALAGGAAEGLVWAGYLSTTGVYGDARGAWVDEDSPLAPGTARGKARLSAEREWQALAGQAGLALHIFRLAGIYGPGRGPFARLRGGEARRIVKPGQVFSRIHVDDIAAALAASMARPMPGAVWNLSDELPAPPQDVTEYAAHLAGLPVPPAVDFAEVEAGISAMARSFYAESKRVSSRRIRRDLGLTLRYPDYRAGLAQILQAEAAEEA